MLLGRPMGLGEKIFYGATLALGMLALGFTIRGGYFAWTAFLLGSPIIATIVGAYFWIRLDVWRSEKTIETLSSEDEAIKRDLFSRRADCRMAFALLALAAAAQIYLLGSISERLHAMVLLLLPPSVINCVARSMEEIPK